MIAVELGGWLAASAAGVSRRRGAWRALAWRMESVARACHELRGPLTAARLGLDWRRRQRRALAGPPARDRPGARPRRAGARRPRGRADPAACGRGPPDAIDSSSSWPTRSRRGGRPRRRAGSSCASRGRARAAPCWGDRLRLAQATGNLIANAIEHGGGAGRGARPRRPAGGPDRGDRRRPRVAGAGRRAGARAPRGGRGRGVAGWRSPPRSRPPRRTAGGGAVGARRAPRAGAAGGRSPGPPARRDQDARGRVPGLARIGGRRLISAQPLIGACARLQWSDPEFRRTAPTERHTDAGRNHRESATAAQRGPASESCSPGLRWRTPAVTARKPGVGVCGARAGRGGRSGGRRGIWVALWEKVG